MEGVGWSLERRRCPRREGEILLTFYYCSLSLSLSSSLSCPIFVNLTADGDTAALLSVSSVRHLQSTREEEDADVRWRQDDSVERRLIRLLLLL